jgi:hypothetical protein
LAQSKKRRTNLLGEPWGWTNTNGHFSQKSQSRTNEPFYQKSHQGESGAYSSYHNGFVWESNHHQQQQPLVAFDTMTHMANTQSTYLENNSEGGRRSGDSRNEVQLLIEEDANIPVRTRIDLFGSSSSSSSPPASSSSSSSNSKPAQDKPSESQQRSELFTPFESALDMMNETIPNDVTGDVHVDDHPQHQHDPAEDITTSVDLALTAASVTQEVGQEEEEEVTRDHQEVLNSENGIAERNSLPNEMAASSSSNSSSSSTAFLFAPVFADLIDAQEAEHIVAEQEQELMRASSSSPITYLHQSRPSSSLQEASSSSSSTIEKSFSPPNLRNSSAFDKTIPLQPSINDDAAGECSSRSDQTTRWTSSNTKNVRTSNNVEATAATPTICAFSEIPRLRDSQLERARPAQAPSHPANVLGQTPRVVMSSHSQSGTQRSSSRAEGEEDEKLDIAALNSETNGNFPAVSSSVVTPLLHSSFGFNDSITGSSSRYNHPLTSSMISSPASFSAPPSTWFVTVDSLSLHLPLPSPFASGPDGTKFSTSINIKNGSSSDLRVTVFGPADSRPLVISAIQDAQQEVETLSETLNGSSKLASPLSNTSSEMGNKEKGNKDSHNSTSLWQPLSLYLPATVSTSFPVDSSSDFNNTKNITLIPSRSFGQVHVRFALPQTGRRVDMRGWTFNDEKRAATASLWIVETAKLASANDQTSYSPSTTINQQLVKVTVAESMWRNLGFAFDASSCSLYSTGEVLPVDTYKPMSSSSSSSKSSHFNSVNAGSSSSANPSSTAPFMSPALASHPTGGYGPRLPLGIGLSSVLQSPPRPALTSSFAASHGVGSPKHERILLPSNSLSNNISRFDSSEQISTKQEDFYEISRFPSLQTASSMNPPEMVQTSSSSSSSTTLAMRTAKRSTQKVSQDHSRVGQLQSNANIFERNTALSTIDFDEVAALSIPKFTTFSSTDTQRAMNLPPAPPVADKPKARTGLGPFASPPGTSTVISTSAPAALSSSGGVTSSSPSSPAPGVRFPMRTLLFPSDSNVLKVELSNTSQMPLRVKARLTCPGMDVSGSAAQSQTPFFHLKKNHMEFDLLPRRYVLIPVSFKGPADEEGADKSSHACTLIVEARHEQSEGNFEGLTLKSKVLLVKE